MRLSFPDAVERVREEFVANALNGEDRIAYVREPSREDEARAVAGCVERLADYEIDPPAHGRGVGRFAPKSLVPPIADLIGRRKLEDLDTESRDRLADAIVSATAVGYLSMAGLEPDATGINPRVDLDAEDTWNLWVVRLNASTLNEVGLPRSVQDDISNGASTYFTMKLREADLLPKMRKRMRYGMVGKWYGQAGMVLRMIQGGEPSTDSSEDLWQVTNSWPFDRTNV